MQVPSLENLLALSVVMRFWIWPWPRETHPKLFCPWPHMEQGFFVQRRMEVLNCSTHSSALIDDPFRAEVMLTMKLLGRNQLCFNGFSVEAKFFT